MRAQVAVAPGTVRVLVAVAVATAAGLAAYAVAPLETLAQMAIWWAFNLAAAAACMWRATRSSTLRFGWVWLACGVFLYTAGDISWDLNSLEGASNVNTVGDILYQVAYVTLGIGLWLLGGREEDAGLEDLADTVLWAAALGGAAYLWLWLPTARLGLDSATLRSNAFTLATMVGLATLVLRNIMAAHTYRKLPLLLLTAGVGFVIVADVSFWFQGAAAGWNSSGEFDAAGWDYLYMLGWAMVAAGALLPTADALRRRREAPASGLVRPALGLLVALPVMLALAHSTAPVVAALALTGIIAARTLLLVVDTAGINRRSRMMVAIAGEIVVERQPDAASVEDWLMRIMGPSAAHLRQLDDGDCPRAIAVVPLARSLHSSPTVICVHDWRNRGTRSELLQFARLFAAAYPSVGVGPVPDVSPDSAPGVGAPGPGAFEPVDGG